MKTRPIMSLEGKDTFILKFCFAQVGKVFETLRNLEKIERPVAKGSRPTNGSQVINNAELVSVKTIWADLVKNGFELVDAYVDPWKSDGIEVAAVFCRGEAASAGEYRLPEETIQAFGELFARTWSYSHGWENPDNSVSLLLINPRRIEVLPEQRFSVVGGELSYEFLKPLKSGRVHATR